jgi:hypothetical protein
MDDVQNISKYYYNTQYSESFKVSTLVDFQGNAKKNEKRNEIHQIFLVT